MSDPRQPHGQGYAPQSPRAESPPVRIARVGEVEEEYSVSVPTSGRLRPTTDVLGIEVVPLFERQPLTIGRDPSNILHLYDVRVSRRHARIECQHGVCQVVDQRSSNGVYVNGQRIAPEPAATQLRHGDIVEIGNLGIIAFAFEELRR